MLSAANIPLFVAVFVAAIAAWFDWRTGHIPNRVTLGPLAAAPIVYFAVVITAKPFAEAALSAGLSILGALACSIVPLILFRIGAMGGVDVKLLAAVGALAGMQTGIEAEFYSFMAAALVVPARLAWEGQLLRVLGNTVAIVMNPFLPEKRRRTLSPEMLTTVRFGPAIFVGTVIAALLQWRLR